MFNTDYYNSRYFNKLHIDNDLLVKTSTNMEKIKSEYDYYYYLPQSVQRFFVQPFGYNVKDGTASYKMEFINHSNLAKLFETEYVGANSFLKILNKIDTFKEYKKLFSKEEVFLESKYLVLEKTKNRIKNSDTELFNRLEFAFNKYINLRTTWNKKISHGDLCFSNIIWIEEIDMLKFIDPRGAKQEGDIFMDEYYDLAKISHSIFGGYESIIYNTTINYDHIQNLFYNYLNKNKISIELLKVYEASLFLSMTPLHVDKPENVEQFLDKCDKILKEVGC
jgi:hypothetical protein